MIKVGVGELREQINTLLQRVWMNFPPKSQQLGKVSRMPSKLSARLDASYEAQGALTQN
jgi:hypothetical protein